MRIYVLARNEDFILHSMGKGDGMTKFAFRNKHSHRGRLPGKQIDRIVLK